MRSNCAWGLGRLYPDLVEPRQKEVVECLLQTMLHDAESGVREEARLALEQLEQPEVLERLQTLPEDVGTVLLIGHNEGIGECAATRAGQGPGEALQRLRDKYPTGALATLALRQGPWSDLAPGTCELVAFVRPRDLDPR